MSKTPFLNWEQIAVDMRYTGKWIKKLHEKALDAVSEILALKGVPISSL